ncbi:phage/plasmid primase, P4 family [Listeria sp. ILCC797]|uniref:phage/plasmid primase, P4 family n=1 Tax=Listeria sp. ILCC797 TaxID=1918333 RepID=UPI000B58AF9D|nr:phage/plasmid primase, P4 family [Listeria sp. ILCC797]
MYERIPDELKQLKQWCAYQLVWDEKRHKHKKIPKNANTGGNGNSVDEGTWADFETALASLEKYQFDGLGFYFKEPYFGVDIDDIENEIEDYRLGNTDNIVAEFIQTLSSYTEYSVSGTGIHIISKGDFPNGGRRKNNVEMYNHGRFFVMTGQVVDNYETVNESTQAIQYLHSKYIGTNELQTVSHEHAGVDLPASEIIQKAYSSQQGVPFKTLYEGFWEGLYTSQSDADLAFANMLAFWTGADYVKMDEIFRTSGLMRTKWDTKRGASTYGERTLNKAIAECQNVYTPSNPITDFEIKIANTGKTRKLYSQDDTGNAERFRDEFQNLLRYSYVNKGWYYYNSKLWMFDNTGRVKALADTVIQNMKKDFAYMEGDSDEEKAFMKHLKATRSNKGKTNMIKESEHLLPVLPEQFDTNPYYFNSQNGFVNLRTGQLKEHDRTQMFTKISLVEYTDKIDAPLWEQFLKDIFNNDEELIRYIQKAVGYSLTGSTQEQVMFILYGNGRNGKSVFLDIINDIFGTYATNIQPQTIMVKQQTSNANSDIARLQSARFVTTTEPNEGVRLDEGLVKQLTGGDKVTARHLYKNEFEFTPEFKIWMATNHKPIIRGRDDGIWRRLHLIPFIVKIPDYKVDKQLKYKLRSELTGILNWAVEGCLKWQTEGLGLPKAVKQASAEYKSEMDVITAFIEDCCEVGEDKNIKAKVLYETYRDWAKNNGQYVMSNTKFGKEITLKFSKKRANTGFKYEGITLNSEYFNLSFNF